MTYRGYFSEIRIISLFTGVPRAKITESGFYRTAIIGNLQQNGNRIENKRSTFNSKYNPTQIDRVRKIIDGKDIAQTVDEFIEEFHRIIKSPNGIREVCLVVNFLSKGEFTDVMTRIKNNQDFREKRNVIQFFWLLSSFVSSCKECDLHCRIICHE